MRKKGIRPGDMLVGRKPALALLVKQTKKYYYFNIDNQIVRASKDRVWRHIDVGDFEVMSSAGRRKNKRKGRTLDLHGTKHGDVDEKVRQFLNFVELPCTVITGDSSQMKDLVKKVVEEYGWHQRESYSNYGEVIIEEK
tara:strand:+ start:54928 stop:55344 length:417 start_codon:yes stop_codon:yes gene_type:complete